MAHRGQNHLLPDPCSCWRALELFSGRGCYVQYVPFGRLMSAFLWAQDPSVDPSAGLCFAVADAAKQLSSGRCLQRQVE